MKVNPLPSYEFVREHFEYNADTGILSWKKAISSRAKVGNAAYERKAVELFGEFARAA